MPSTVGGLLIFIVFLTPGFLNYIQRRRRVPQRRLSPLVEVATFLTVSLVTNLIAVGAFAIVRGIIPGHTPNVSLWATEGFKYASPRLGYIFEWGLGLLAFSSLLATIAGWRGIFGRLTPVIIDASTWYQLFEHEPQGTAPSGSRVFLGCDLKDGSYISGYLAWYNTDVEEHSDRDLALASPVTVRSKGKSSVSDFARIILSARDIKRIHVAYLNGGPQPVSQPAGRVTSWVAVVGLAVLAVAASVGSALSSPHT